MKRTLTLIALTAVICGFSAGSSASAAHGKAGGQKRPRPNREQIRAQILERFDTNHDGKITGEERVALEQAKQQFRAQHMGDMRGGKPLGAFKRGQGGAGKLQSAQHGKFRAKGR
jgi:hypothetical protein